MPPPIRHPANVTLRKWVETVKDDENDTYLKEVGSHRKLGNELGIESVFDRERNWEIGLLDEPTYPKDSYKPESYGYLLPEYEWVPTVGKRFVERRWVYLTREVPRHLRELVGIPPSIRAPETPQSGSSGAQDAPAEAGPSSRPPPRRAESLEPEMRERLRQVELSDAPPVDRSQLSRYLRVDTTGRSAESWIAGLRGSGWDNPPDIRRIVVGRGYTWIEGSGIADSRSMRQWIQQTIEEERRL
uniref:Uncharacterized protein n=1 Tax=Mycena chlorophos TaxID=658473 RepID=A0ABQ0KWP9_MYCCL|nr:predicted protein [Mycena chlorophos]